ncbi:hypothetical protein V6B08_09255 [Ferrovibrio sp. MS7]|uniref:hypothetical protein n=1 Tax=Ferrovibrio plantarum TaxID=3119164 RepID=UPI003136BC10
MTTTAHIRASFLLLTLTLAACSPVETKTTLMTPGIGQIRSAGPGDTVMAFQIQRSLPNAFGNADMFGRTVNAGRTTVRYIGTLDGRAVFERSQIAIDSNATTMSETPLIVPQTTTSSMSGSVGTTPVTATSRSTSTQVIGPRGSTEYASQTAPIHISLGAGESVPIEGKRLRVVRVTSVSVDYVIE